MTQADPEDRQVVRRLFDQVQADTGLVWRLRSRRQQDGFRTQRQGFGDAERIIAHDKRLGPKLVQIVDEVVGKAVVVIDDQDHGCLIGFAVARAKGDAGLMTDADSNLDADEIARCRALLEPSARHETIWPALAAATALAVSSLVFATVMILAPPVQTEHVAVSAPE